MTLLGSTISAIAKINHRKKIYYNVVAFDKRNIQRILIAHWNKAKIRIVLLLFCVDKLKLTKTTRGKTTINKQRKKNIYLNRIQMYGCGRLGCVVGVIKRTIFFIFVVFSCFMFYIRECWWVECRYKCLVCIIYFTHLRQPCIKYNDTLKSRHTEILKKKNSINNDQVLSGGVSLANVFEDRLSWEHRKIWINVLCLV